METETVPSPSSYANYSTTWTPPNETTSISTNPSRKRSRDETAFEASEVESSYLSAPSLNPPEPIPEEPIYGEGMVLLNPQTGRALAAETQTGTWFEEKVEEEEAIKKAEATARPKMATGRKSVRLSQSSIRAALDLPNLSMPDSPPKSAPSAEIDEATIALGIGWTKMSSDDPDQQAAVRGWARYLDVHYPSHVHGAEILLKNRSLDAYLVGCQEGFYLFQEDLLRGQLVGRTWDNALHNLRSQPMQFEGTEVLQAERTPGPDSDTTKIENTNAWQTGHQFGNQATTINHTEINGSASALGMDLD